MKQAKTLSKIELKRVLAVIAAGRHPQRNKIVILLSFFAGLRAKEISALKIGDIYAEDRTVKRTVMLLAQQTKGTKARTVFLNSTLLKALTTYCSYIDFNSPESSLIESQKHVAFSPNSMCQLMCRIYKDAGIWGASSHSGRRSFITKLANKGVSAKVLMELAGHKNLATTQRYIDVNEKMLMEAVELA